MAQIGMTHIEEAPMPYRAAVDSKLDRLFRAVEESQECFSPNNVNEANAVRRRLKTGSLIKVYYGLYARSEYWNAISRRQQIQHVIRALSKLHPSWVFSHSSAAAMHNLEVSYQLYWPVHYQTDISRSNRKNNKLINHRVQRVAGQEKNGALVCSCEQTVVDCAAEFPFKYALAIADSSLHQGLTSKEKLESYLDSRLNRRNVNKARKVIALADSRPDSGGESVVRAIMHELHLPEPELQAQIPNPERPGHNFYLDYLFTNPNGIKVGMELDGIDKYADQTMTKGRSAIQVLAEEQHREMLITSHGIQLVRFTYREACNTGLLLSRLSHYGITPLK